MYKQYKHRRNYITTNTFQGIPAFNMKEILNCNIGIKQSLKDFRSKEFFISDSFRFGYYSWLILRNRTLIR
jgi:hypothetical protein